MSLALGRSLSPRQNCPCDGITNILLNDTWFLLCLVSFELLKWVLKWVFEIFVVFCFNYHQNEWVLWNKRTVEFGLCSWKRDMTVFPGGNFRENEGQMWMYKYGTYNKRPSGVHWRITCLCNIVIRFYFLVNIFVSFFYVNYKFKSALPQHRRVMFISSGFMCLLDLPIQMI